MSFLAVSRLRLAIYLSTAFHLLMIVLAWAGYVISGENSPFIKLAVILGWPAGALIALIPGGLHGISETITTGLLALAVSMTLYAAVAWVLVVAAQNYGHRLNR